MPEGNDDDAIQAACQWYFAELAVCQCPNNAL
jgi:hypothetical protein